MVQRRPELEEDPKARGGVLQTAAWQIRRREAAGAQAFSPPRPPPSFFFFFFFFFFFSFFLSSLSFRLHIHEKIANDNTHHRNARCLIHLTEND